MLRRRRQASLRQRFAAASVDGALVGGTFTLIFGRWLRPSGEEDLYARRALVAGVGLGLWLLDQAIANAAFGRRTIGMAAARIELVTADGRPASLPRYYVRGLGARVFVAPAERLVASRLTASQRMAISLATLLADAAVVAARRDRRSVGDLVAGTRVVEGRRR